MAKNTKTISVECPACNKVQSVPIDKNAMELSHVTPKGENQMGDETTYEMNGKFVCEHCGKEWNSIKIVEYPHGRNEYAYFE